MSTQPQRICHPPYLMNTRSKTKNLDLTNPIEFPSLPPRSRNPFTVLPPMTSTPPESEFTLPPLMMEQASNGMASGDNPAAQPTTGSSTMVSISVLGPDVTSTEGVRTPNPSALEGVGTPLNLVMDGSVAGRVGGSKVYSS